MDALQMHSNWPLGYLLSWDAKKAAIFFVLIVRTIINVCVTPLHPTITIYGDGAHVCLNWV